jgi:hypothetical protein
VCSVDTIYVAFWCTRWTLRNQQSRRKSVFSAHDVSNIAVHNVNFVPQSKHVKVYDQWMQYTWHCSASSETSATRIGSETAWSVDKIHWTADMLCATNTVCDTVSPWTWRETHLKVHDIKLILCFRFKLKHLSVRLNWRINIEPIPANQYPSFGVIVPTFSRYNTSTSDLLCHNKFCRMSSRFNSRIC